MRTASSIVIVLLALLCAPRSHAQYICEPLTYYNPGGTVLTYTHPLPTPWFGVRMSVNWTATVDTAYFFFGINRTVPTQKRDTMQVRVLANILPSFMFLDQIEFEIMPNLSGNFPDANYIAEFMFASPQAWIDPPGDFWLSWRLKGPITDQARIKVKDGAINPLRSVIINPNGTTTLATTFMTSQLNLRGDSVDLIAEARVCYPYGTPVELVNLSAVSIPGGALLQWNTATESNNHGFEILRLQPGDNNDRLNLWQRIGFVEGHGTSTQPHGYQYIDRDIDGAADEQGVVRYRLRQIDFDGRSEMSPVVELQLDATALRFDLGQCYPNPVSAADGSAVLSFTLPREQRVRVEVYDALGRLLSVPVAGVFGAGAHVAELQTAALTPGVYYYRLIGGDGTLSRKFTVTR